MSTSNNPSSAGQSLDDAINAVKGGLTAAPAANQIDSWIGMLDLNGPGSQGEIALELKNLKDYISSNDSANIAHTLDALGQLATRAADEDVDEEIRTKLLQLGETLTGASTSLPK
ncbi:hypothetical protein [Hymenobacter lapidiphilus]|uniref:Uncharacterized protein n=1 Tax=Hymenobacter lapidiphilus TaxID=2608003 RepID=A0A7Y7U6N4_9BACT|nr:hypothetical protein [Hymenobacter lapidiphilus]NVO32713.1 hypothetical protein [Hymenobacter lapidiphilus]